MTKNWQTVNVPLASGLAMRGDPRAMSPVALDKCFDAEFDDQGGLLTRKPFSELGNLIAFDGNPIADHRHIVKNGTELLMFTKDKLYSWSEEHQAWVSKGTHLAVAVDEASVFATTGDQIEADRAELEGVIVYAWTDSQNGVYMGAVDAETRSVVKAPTAVGSGSSRPRLVALDDRVILFAVNGSAALVAYAIDPENPNLSTTGTVVAAPTFGGSYYDVCRVGTSTEAAFVASVAGSASYVVGRVAEDLTVASSTKGRTSLGCLAIASTAAGDRLQVARNTSGAIKGDQLVASTLADVYTGQSIGLLTGTLAQHITAAFRSTQDSGVYRCYVYWTDEQVSGISFWVSSNWVSTGNTLGTSSVLKYQADIGSHAFEREGRVYLWAIFANPSSIGADETVNLQNTYFLVRDDGFQVAKAAADKAGGVPTQGHLPSVANTSSNEYAFCGIERRVFDIGGAPDRRKYGARVPRDVMFEFDTNRSRRCVRLGETLYITGGEILAYDGVQLVECGFHVFPFALEATQTSSGTGLANGTYAAKMTWRWDNAKGEIDRSSTATTATLTIASGPDGMRITWGSYSFTHKIDRPIAAEIWRTAVNPTSESAFYLTTSKDPSASSNPNRYLENTIAANGGDTFEDELADADLADNEAHPENGLVLENLAPPAATIIAATSERLFLAGVAGAPHQVWYSKQRNQGEVAAFHDALTVQVPPTGGDITGLGFLNETLIVFREKAVYVLAGDGFDNAGGGSNYGPARQISSDVGAVNHESIALTPRGLVFKSRKGWYLLNQGWSLEYIGGQVSDYDDEDVLSVHVVEAQHQVRVVLADRMLVLDYLNRSEAAPYGQWSVWTEAANLAATTWGDQYILLKDHDTAPGPYYQRDDFGADIVYGMDVETAWIKLNDLQGAGSVRWLSILGEYRGDHTLRVRLARDYLFDDSAQEWLYYQEDRWDPTPTVVGGPLMCEVGPSIPKCMAIKVRISAARLVWDEGEDPDVDEPTVTYPTTEALKLTGLALDVGIDRGINRRLPAAQKV